MIAHLPLVRLEARCEYFENGACRDLQFVLSPSSIGLARSRNLLVRCMHDSITIYATAGGEPTRAVGSEETLTLTTKVFAGDTDFANYADLDGRSMDRVFRFDSSRAMKGNEGSGYRLHEAPWAGTTDLMPVTAPELDGVLDARERLAPPLAVVTLHVNPREVADAARVPSYYFAFRARRTVWKYYVLGATQKEAALSIRDPDGTVEFVAGTGSPERLGNDRSAVTLLSNSPIALRERPNQRFQLRSNTPDGGKVLVRRLAVPSPRQLAKEIVNGREVAVSEIYINL